VKGDLYMSYFQVIAIPIRNGSKSLREPFVDRRLYSEMSGVDERTKELQAVFPSAEYELQIIVVVVI